MTADHIQHVLILGAGTMGRQIAWQCATHGFDVTLTDADPAALERAMTAVARFAAGAVGSGALREADARAAFLRGIRFLADEAARIGLINRAVPAEDLDAAVDEIVQDLLAGGPNAIAATKRLLAEVPGMPVDDAFAWTQQFSAELFTSDEAKEGMGAFLEKRPASWVPTPD